jgi:hypothetical protein
MTMPPFALLVVVIDRAGTCTYARADECAFPSANQRTSSRTYRCTNPDALRSLLFPASGFR